MKFRDSILDLVSKSNLQHQNVYTNKGSGLENIDKALLFKIRKLHKISKEAEIFRAYSAQQFKPGSFFEAERTFYDSVLVLESGISMIKIEETTGWAKSEDLVIDLLWSDFDSLEVIKEKLKDDDGKPLTVLILRLYSSEESNFIDVPLEMFGKLSTEDEAAEITILLSEILQAYAADLSKNDQKYSEILDDISNKINSSEYKVALDIINENFDWDLLLKSKEQMLFYLADFKANALEGLKLYDDAINVVNEAIERYGCAQDPESCKSHFYGLRGKLNEQLNKYDLAIQDFEAALLCSPEFSERTAFKKSQQLAYNMLKSNFSQISFNHRRTILIHDEVKATELNDFLVLDKANLPPEIVFPIGHPKVNEVYVAHPYLQNVYTPYAIYDAFVFDSKFEEFSYFLQCLGAKSVKIEVLKGKDLKTTNNKATKVEASAEFGKKAVKNNLDASLELKGNKEENTRSVTSRTRTQVYSPTKKPYVPDDLIWYHNEPSWQRLYQQRISGNILRHEDLISSKNSHSISKTDDGKLRVAYKNFFTNMKVNAEELVENTFSDTESIEWRVTVEFESIEDLNGSHSDLTSDKIALSDNALEEYLDEVKFMLDDDGRIDEKERSVLERIRIKKGIDKEMAIYLENDLLLSSALSDNEKEYLEEYRELLQDGPIEEKERRILARFATRLELSEEQVLKLESLSY